MKKPDRLGRAASCVKLNKHTISHFLTRLFCQALLEQSDGQFRVEVGLKGIPVISLIQHNYGGGGGDECDCVAFVAGGVLVWAECWCAVPVAGVAEWLVVPVVAAEAVQGLVEGGAGEGGEGGGAGDQPRQRGEVEGLVGVDGAVEVEGCFEEFGVVEEGGAGDAAGAAAFGWGVAGWVPCSEGAGGNPAGLVGFAFGAAEFGCDAVGDGSKPGSWEWVWGWRGLDFGQHCWTSQW